MHFVPGDVRYAFSIISPRLNEMWGYLESILDPVVRVSVETQFGVSCLPFLAPSPFRWEFGWPILAFTKDRTMTLLELLEGTIHVDSIGIVPARLSSGIGLALTIDAPRQ